MALFLILSAFVTILTFNTVHGYQATIRANGSSNHAPVNANVASGLAYDGTKGMVTMWFDHAYISQFPAMQNMSADGIKGGILIVYDKANTGGYGSWSDLKEKQKEGWELISHSIDHQIPMQSSPQPFYNYEIIMSYAALKFAQGITTIGYASPADVMTTQSMVTINETYQWGSLGICKQNDLNTIKNDAKIRFGLNGIIPMLHHCGVDSVGAAPLNNFAQIKSMIDTAAQMHTWLVLNFHQIDNIPEPFHTTPQMFKQILDYVKAKVDNGTITTVTPCQGLGQC